MKVVIIIPTYNEAENTVRMISELEQVLPHIPKHKVEVLYVDGNSPDGTADIIKQKQKHLPWLHLLIETKKEGLGMAYAKGMTHAMEELKADYLMEFDSDFQHPPRDIPRLVEQIDNGFDYIIGSRYIKGGSIPSEWDFKRKFLSVVGNLVARVLLILPHIHDVTGGFKLARVRGFMDEFDFSTLLSRSFAYKIHLLFYMVQKGARVKEVPFAFAHRTSGESKIIKNEMQETLRVIFLLQAKNPKIRKFIKFGTVGFIGFLINAVALELFRSSPVIESLAFSFGVVPLLSNPNSWSGGLAAEMAIISNFILNNFWTFSSEKITSPLKFLLKFLQFNISSFGGVVIQFIVIGLATRAFGDNTLVRQIALVLSIAFLIIPYNWFVYNHFIWKTKKK